jgi:hypothetical protein
LNRRFTFSNPNIIRRLQNEFVPFSGDCSEMQFCKTQTSKWLMSIINQMDDKDLKYQRAHGEDTIQGLYIICADGTSFGWLNDNDAANVDNFMDRALAAFRQTPGKSIAVSKELLAESWGRTPPDGTKVVRVFSRIRPLPSGSGDINNSVGRDHLWIYPREVEQLVEAAQQSKAYALPRPLVARMVRFHLIDNVRGEPDMWRDTEIRQADFPASTISNTSQAVTIAFDGHFAQQTKNNKRGLEGSINGIIEIDKSSKKITRFRAIGQGVAWGVSRFTPGAPAGRFPMQFAMIDTDDAIAKVVPPEAVYYDYETPALAVGAPSD